MAVLWTEEARVSRAANGGYVTMPENIILKPDLNGRSEDTDITELAEDILHRGQLISGICCKSEDGWPVLIAGHRRLRAIVELNKSVPNPEERTQFKFNYIQVKNDEEALDLTVAENRNRTDINSMDDATNIAIYVNRFGRSLEDIARKYFPGATSPTKLAAAVQWVKDRQKLLELSPEAQDKLRKGEFSTSAAKELSKLQQKDQNKVLKDAEAKGKKIKVRDAKNAVEAVTPPKPRKSISENTPVKLLNKFKILAEAAGGLAAEVTADEPDWDVVSDLARSLMIMCKKLGIPLLPKADKWAEDHKDDQTPMEVGG